MLIKIIPPSPKLSEYIIYYWHIEGYREKYTEIVYPTGETQILFHYEIPFQDMSPDGKVHVQPRFALYGQKTEYSNVSLGEKTGTIGIVFYPHAASAFLPFPMNEVTDSIINIADIYPEWKFTEEAFMNCTLSEERIKIIEELLLQKLTVHNIYYYSIAKLCVKDMYVNRGNISIGDILSKYDLKERTLQRIFQDTVGLSPKKVSGFIKLKHAVELCKNNSTHTKNCFEAGYYDQPDFNKTIKKYTGCTPDELRKICG